jgi:hypothetical protein
MMNQGGAQKSTAAFPIWEIAGGVVANMSAASLPEGAASYSDNVLFYDKRAIPRPGFSVPVGNINPNFTNNSVINHMNLLESTLSAANSTYLFIAVSIYASNSLTFSYYSPANNTYAELGASEAFTTNSNHNPTSAQFIGSLFVCPIQQNLQMWAGAGSALVDVTTAQPNAALRAPANPYFICATAQRLFLANAVDLDSGQRQPYRVWWSDNFNPNVWMANDAGLPAQGASGWQDLSSDSSPITGMVFQGSSRPVVFKNDSIHTGVYVGGPEWYNFAPITRSRGCFASGSIKLYNDVILWLGNDCNVYSMDPANNITALGDAIRPLLQYYYNPVYASQISAQVDTVLGLYWISIPIGLEQGSPFNINKLFVLNMHTGAWAVQTMSDSSFYLSSSFNLPVTPSYTSSRTPSLNVPEPFSSSALQLWGTSNGQILNIDYSHPEMVDGKHAKPFNAQWWGKTRDFLYASQLGYPGKVPTQAKGEVSEWAKMALHGTYGQANPCIRMGSTLAEVQNSRHVTLYDTMDVGLEAIPQAYTATARADAARFGQFGIYWPFGSTDPMAVDGMTAWGTPLNQDSR